MSKIKRASQADIDRALKGDAPFRRFSSFSAAGINLAEFALTSDQEREIPAIVDRYQAMFKKKLAASFPKPVRTRAEYGPWINTEEALEGEPSCWRAMVNRALQPIKVMINLSRAAESAALTGMRGGAILALLDLCKRQNQQVQIEVAYGNGWSDRCHVRINTSMPTRANLIRLCCSSDGISVVGKKLINPLLARHGGGRWHGGYRFFEMEARGLPVESDFVLDRIDTACLKTEEDRILKSFAKFGLL